MNQIKLTLTILFITVSSIVLAQTGISNMSKYGALAKQGSEEVRERQYTIAIRTLTSAIAENPRDWESYSNRGIAYFMLDDINRASDDLNTAITINPNNSNLYYIRGNIYMKQGYANRAVAEFEFAIQLNPKHADAHLKCAIVYGKMNDMRKFCMYAEKACELGNKEACQGYANLCKSR